MSEEEKAKRLLVNALGIPFHPPSSPLVQKVKAADARKKANQLNAKMDDQIAREFLNTIFFDFENEEGPFKKLENRQKELWEKKQAEIREELALIPDQSRKNYVANESKKAFEEAFRNIQKLRYYIKEDASVAGFARAIFQSCASMLLEAAQNNPTFLPTYGHAITKVVIDAHSIVKGPKEEVKGYLAQMESWPLNITLNKKLDEHARELLKGCGLGEKSIPRLRNSIGAGKKVGSDGPSNAYTIKLIRYVKRIWENREWIKNFEHQGLVDVSAAHQKVISLLPLTQETAREWFTAAWAIVLEQNENNPEENPKLSPLGEYRRKHVHVAEPQSKARGLSASAAKIAAGRTEMSNIREGIHTKIQEAFYRLTRLHNLQRKPRPRKG